MTDKSNYAVQHFHANSVSDLADKIQQYFDSVSVVANVHYSFRNISYFTKQEVNRMNYQDVKLTYEAILTLRVKQE